MLGGSHEGKHRSAKIPEKKKHGEMRAHRQGICTGRGSGRAHPPNLDTEIGGVSS